MYLIVGENGDEGITLYQQLVAKYTDGYVELEEKIFIDGTVMSHIEVSSSIIYLYKSPSTSTLALWKLYSDGRIEYISETGGSN